MTASDLFQRVVAALEQADIEYMLTGSFASSYHGVPRATQDVDIVISATPEQLQSLGAALPPSEYYFDLGAALKARQREGLFNVIDLATGWKVDFIFRKSRAFSRSEFDRRAAIELEGVRLYIASAEDVLIAKLEWAKLGESERQIQDAAGILRIRSADLDMDYLGTWVRELALPTQWEAARNIAGSAEPGH